MSTTGSVARTLKRSLAAVVGDTRFVSAVDRVLFSFPVRGAAPRRWHVLLAAPGAGNIGDQAMFETFLENVSGEVLVVVRTPGDVAVPDHARARTTVVALDSLLYGRGAAHYRDVLHLKKLLTQAKSFSVTGADIMDGAYNQTASVHRSNFARLARRLQLDTRVLGFSWNGRAEKRARAALQRAAADGVRLLLRDPISAQRARADGLCNVIESADTVFSASSVAEQGAQALLDTLGVVGPFALVNASALIGDAPAQLDAYRGIVRHLQRAGLAVILLPHVARAQGGDLTVCRALYEALGSEQLFLVDRLLAPAEVRALSRRATVVVTGRMHLAIIALSNAVPAITLATQGKVEGLMKLFGTEAWCIEPQRDFGDRVIEVVQDVLSKRAHWVEALAGRLEEVRMLSQRNFAGLES